MKSILVSGTAGSGKTAIALGLALKLRELGISAGYFKPIGAAKGLNKNEDEDVVLFRQVLNLPHDPSTLSPFRTGPYYLSGGASREPERVQARIKDAFDELSRDTDLLLVDGSMTPFTAASLGLDNVKLARLLGSTILYVIRIEDDYSLDKAIFHNDHYRLAGLPVLGNIFNNVERTLLDKTKGVYTPILNELGHRVIGIIPQKAEIAAPTVNEFYDVLGGELLTGEDSGMNRLVEEVVIGSMTIESALGYLRRAPNKAVITGGDRSDMALTALETSTSVLILTGGLYPDVGVISRAIEKNVPVILVHYDTYTTIGRLHQVARRIRPDDRQGIEISRTNISEYCDLKAIFDYIQS